MHVPEDKVLRLAMLFHDVAKPHCLHTDENGIHHFHGHPREGASMARMIMRRLKFDNDTIDRVASLILWHDDNPPLIPAEIRKAMHRIGLRQFPNLFLIKRGDVMGKSSAYRKEMLDYIDAYQQMYESILKKGECISLKTMAVTGADLIACGIRPGREMGELLEYLLSLVLEQPEKNTKEFLLQKAAEWA